MAILKDYNGNPIEIPTHTHVVTDTKANGSTALASTVRDGFMSKEYKTILDNLKTKADQMNEKLKTGLYIKYYSSTLITQNTFRANLSNKGPNATTVVFTSTPIPSDKLSTGTVVSTTDSEVKTYMYLDGTTIYIAPEKENTIIYANPDSSNFFLAISSKITTIDFENFNTSKVTTMANMFTNSSSITQLLHLDNFDTSKVTNMSSMFSRLEKVTTLNLISFNTINVTTMRAMFNSCKLLTSIIFSTKFNTSNVTDMGYMFSYCAALTTIDLSFINTSNITDATYMFFYATNIITTLTISATKSVSMTSMFGGAATGSSAKVTVNYIIESKTIANNMVGTKSSTSNITLGSQV